MATTISGLRRGLLIVSILVLPLSTQAQFSYTVQNGSITIGHYYPSNGGEAVTIPDQINGLPVTAIGANAFNADAGVASVTIPNSVTNIGPGAFSGCMSLTSMTIPNSVANIGDNAFYNCIGLTNITIPNTVTNIGSSAFSYCGLASVTLPNGLTSLGAFVFSYCARLTNITIPNSVTNIGDGAFFSCYGLTGISLPDGVASIGNSAFFECNGLTNITIPNNVKNIGNGAFADCTGLTGVTIPNSVTTIGDGPFTHCTNLVAITVDALNPAFSSLDGVLFDKNQTRLVQCPATKKGSYTMPNTVVYIGNDAFFYCAGLTNITISKGVSSATIGANAFNGCPGLMAFMVDALNPALISVDGVLFNKDPSYLIAFPKGKRGDYVVPDSLTSINDQFDGCAGLTSITIPKTITSIDSRAFSSCVGLNTINVESLNASYSSMDGVLFNKDQTVLIRFPGGKARSYDIPNSVTNIGNYAFDGALGLTSVTIPDTVKSFGINAFSQCAGLTDISIPSSIASISNYVFYGCTGLTSVTIPGSVKIIGEFAFYDCAGLKSVTIPTSVRYIDQRAFAKCASLTNLVIPNSIDRIRNGAFSECAGLTNISLPNTLQVIEDVAFYSCTSLSNITIPNSVAYIGNDAFTHCTGLTSISISQNVSSIGFAGAFNDCTALNAINVEPLNSSYSSLDGVLFNKNQTILLEFPAGKKGNYTVPNTVTSIDDYGFYNCAGLTTVTIPDSVASVGVETFSGCNGLTAAYFLGLPPNTLRLFGNSSSATVYYLPGTAGWGATFQGRPAMAWMPSMDLAKARFETGTHFGFPITWGHDGSVVIEASVDLGNPIWTPVATNTLVNGASHFTDPQSGNAPARFYRLRVP